MDRFLRVVLFCSDVNASRRWYERVGFRYVNGFDGMHFFQLGETEILLHPSEKGSGGGIGLHAGVPNVDALFRHAVAMGLEPMDHQQPGVRLMAPVTRPWGEREFELADPDGHRWVFTQTKG